MKKTLLAAALLSTMTMAHAADAPDRLDPVVVTANRAPTPLDEVLAPVTLITREDIERLQPVSVQDLLVGLPGVAIANTGGIGQQTSLFMRGTNSSHTLVLVDGVRVGTVGAGLPAYEQLPVEQIDHIEIVRGPRSTLYGSDAIGGVIQIFTRHGQAGEAPTPTLSVTGGSHGYTAGQAGISGGGQHGWYNASLGGQYTAGINACRVGAAEAMAGCFTDEPDHDASRMYNGALSGGYRWDDGTELTGSWLRSKGDIEYDGDFQNFTRRSQQVAGGKLAFDVMPAWRMSLALGQNQDRADNYLNGADKTLDFVNYGVDKARVGYLYSKRNQASWQNDVTLAAGQTLTAGVDYQQEKLKSDTDYLADSRNNTGIFALYQGLFGAHELQLSVRHDHNTQFGNHTTGSAAYGFRFDNGMKLTASYGTAFHAPTFNDEFYPYGAPVNLNPETSRTAEIGLSARPGIWNWAVNAYQTTVNDLIGFDANFLPINVSKARIRGIEGQVGADVDGWHVRGYVTLQQPKNRDGGSQDGNLLARRPERTARVDLDKDLGAFTLGGSLNAAGHSFDDAANTRRLGGYATADLRATWHVDADWSVQGRVANLADKRYETAAYYNQLGRTYYLTLRYAPAH
ncbi:TonB-dependent receptor domain-containing protein [Luteibacter sp. UNCMF366Tsu5.1]|uniref:TonB-dependent receptor domain-containing protein n=1 Tax=Luteibacter sp. UNCMF366Tsu5.1 TaxID=1502758 RepID=UPI000908B964|nr:TonB-dependent receptor [Luteibacter sp. UNCMF366Tsu5.1]SFW68073.1 vitamin B12 transporter [Luteibacter sp. UNCMF366Tsu5.1]